MGMFCPFVKMIIEARSTWHLLLSIVESNYGKHKHLILSSLIISMSEVNRHGETIQIIQCECFERHGNALPVTHTSVFDII